jgi:hypothetical protein
MSIIKKYCQRCKKEIFDSGFYLQIFKRANREIRDNCFLCDGCSLKLIEFIDGENGKQD